MDRLETADIQWASYGLNLAIILRTLRRMRGLSQEALAQACGMSRNQISNLERNISSSGKSSDPVLSTVYRIAYALQLPAAVLLPHGDRLVTRICEPVNVIAYDFRWPSSVADVTSYYRQDELIGTLGEHLAAISPAQATLEERLRNHEGNGGGLPVDRG